MTAQHTEIDPFAPVESTPSVSFDGSVPGETEYVLRVLAAPTLAQQTVYGTKELAWWDKEETQPKMAAVIKVRVESGPDGVGEERSLWAKKPGDLFAKIGEAQKTAGAKIAPGGVLRVKHAANGPKEKGKAAAKLYAVSYEAPDSFADEAPF